MLTGNSQDFQKLPVFYFDPQTTATARRVHEKLLLRICTTFPVFCLASFLLHKVFCFQTKLCKLPLDITNFGHNLTCPNAQTQLGWRQFLRQFTWRWAWHTCRTGAVFAPPAPRKGSPSKPLTTALRNNPSGKQKSKKRPGRKSRHEDRPHNEKTLATLHRCLN